MENLILTTLTPAELRQILKEEIEKCIEWQSVDNYKPIEILTGEELGKKLGVSHQSLAAWRKKGKIPFFQLGSAIRYDLNKVLEALEQNKTKKEYYKGRYAPGVT